MANFEDGNTIFAASKDMDRLINLLEKESEVAIKWSEGNNSILLIKTKKLKLKNLSLF